MAARWVICPVIQRIDVNPDPPPATIPGAFAPKVAEIADPGRPGKNFKHSSVIDPAINWCLSYVVGMDFTPLDADPEIIDLFEENESPGASRKAAHVSFLGNTPAARGWNVGQQNRIKARMTDKGADVSALAATTPLDVWIRQLARAHTPSFPDNGAFATWVD